MEHFRNWLGDSKFKYEMGLNGYYIFRNTNHEKDANYHDCCHYGEVCSGCRACVFNTCELTHAYLCFLFKSNWTDKQIGQVFDLTMVNVKRHRHKYPGGCHVKLRDETSSCNLNTQFKLSSSEIHKAFTDICVW